MSIATTILEQLGGNKFKAMTGAKNFLDTGNGLMFTIPKAKDGINKIIVTLTCEDEYIMEFAKLRGVKYTLIKKVEGLYYDQLQSVFTDYTGLLTKL